MPLIPHKYSRVKTFRQHILDLQEFVQEHPEVGDCMMCTVNSSSGAPDNINSVHIRKLTETTFDGEWGFFFEDEGLVAGDTVVELSVGGN